MLGNYSSIFWPSLARQGVRSSGDVLHWVRCIEAFTEFISPQNVVPRQVVLLVIIYARDLYFRAKKDWTGPRIPLDSANHQHDTEGGKVPASPVPLRIEPAESRVERRILRERLLLALSTTRGRKGSRSRPPKLLLKDPKLLLLLCPSLERLRYDTS